MIKKPILIAYASRAGSTFDIAKAIGQALTEHGSRVEVQPVKAVTTLEQYSAVIVGSAIRAGGWLPEAIEFVKQHKSDLEKLPLIYFLVCATMREDTPQHYDEVLAYEKPLRAILEPQEMGLFAGKLDTTELGFFVGAIWAELLVSKLQTSAPVPWMPVFFSVGRNHCLEPPEVSVTYLETTTAPSKKTCGSSNLGTSHLCMSRQISIE